MDRYTYEIENKGYYQEPLGVYQTGLLVDMIKPAVVDNPSATGFLTALGSNLGQFLTVVLIPVGMTKEQHVEELVGGKRGDLHLLTHAAPLLAIEVLEHFLLCNQILSLFERAADLVIAAIEKMETEIQKKKGRMGTAIRGLKDANKSQPTSEEVAQGTG